ncbi:MAG: DUF6320 domain-containing protein [Eubacteriales bacterium]|nr:DUF6320 domain-containing protein [Eubacteriales bacterium]
MSYCVNCGVELDKTCKVCPLCNTRVINPGQPVDEISPKPFPELPGKLDPVQRSDMALLMTVILASTAVVCGFLNLLAFQQGRWSLYVIGICVNLWIFFLPLFFPGKLTPYISLVLDGISIALYFGVISLLHPAGGWYGAIALPVIIVLTLLLLLFLFFLKYLHSSVLALAVVIITEIGGICTVVELLINLFLDRPLSLSWAAIVLTCCIIIDLALITILRRSRLRNEVRRRMHI